MTNKIVCRYAASNLEELQAHLANIASDYGDHPSTVYCDGDVKIAVEEETLSDGSLVYNLLMHTYRIA